MKKHRLGPQNGPRMFGKTAKNSKFPKTILSLLE
jgi:hypothetical protein